MNITKKKTALWVLVLVAVLAAGVYAGVQFAPKYVYVTVEEAISISPDSVSLPIKVGESGSAEFTVTNVASVDIPLSVLAEVTAFPEGGSATDLMLTYSPTLTAVKSGDTFLAIGFTAATGAVAGDYTITVTVTRV